VIVIPELEICFDELTCNRGELQKNIDRLYECMNTGKGPSSPLYSEHKYWPELNKMLTEKAMRFLAVREE